MSTHLSDAERIARRYPQGRTPRRWWLPVAALLTTAGLGWLVWAGWQAANPPVAAHIAGFKVVDDTRIDVQITVQRRDPASRISCQVKALAISYDTVGELPFTWEPTGRQLQTEWVSVRTFKEATTAEIDWCRVAS